MNITIRKASLNDARILSELGRKTFFEKWKGTTSTENMQRYLETAYSLDVIEKELTQQSLEYLLAEVDGQAIAFAKLTHDHPDIDEYEPDVNVDCKNPLEVSRIYVAPELIGNSIGAMLMNRIFEIAAEEHCDLIWLGVWEHNQAVRFYQRLGFIKAGTHKFIMGEQVDTDLVMIKKISPIEK